MPMPSAVPMRRVALALFVAACAEPPAEEPAGGSSPVPPALPARPARTLAPWSGPRLPRGSIPAVYYTQWQNAENRASCALIAPESLGGADSGSSTSSSSSPSFASSNERREAAAHHSGGGSNRTTSRSKSSVTR